MEIEEMAQPTELVLRPATMYAFLRVLPMLIAGIFILLIAWWIFSAFIWISLAIMLIVWYRFLYIRNIRYFITPEVIRIRSGLLVKRLDNLEMYRIRDYIVTQPFIFRIFHLMNLTLKTTDTKNNSVMLTAIPVSDLVDIIRDHVQLARARNRAYGIN